MGSGAEGRTGGAVGGFGSEAAGQEHRPRDGICVSEGHHGRAKGRCERTVPFGRESGGASGGVNPAIGKSGCWGAGRQSARDFRMHVQRRACRRGAELEIRSLGTFSFLRQLFAAPASQSPFTCSNLLED